VVEKIVEVEKDRIVHLPRQDERSLKMELSLSLLVEKLILELKRIKSSNPAINFELEDDVKLIFFAELDTAARMEGDLAGKLKSFSESVNRKFESLGSWSLDHQLMLNSFLQERFLMANLVKSANLEIEKSKSINLKNSEVLRKYESDVDAYRGYLGKLRTSLHGQAGPEIDSLITNIFLEVENYNSGRVETVSYLGDLQVTDLRIQSLLREKDMELTRLRDELLAVKKLKSGINNSEAHFRTLQVVQDENLKLKNEINTLRADRGSAELIISYKQQIQALNERIHELEQEKSDLNARLLNLKNEYEVRLSVQNFNSSTTEFKRSSATNDYNDNTRSDAYRNANMTSPVQKYNINSTISSPKEESFGIKMVDSKIEPNSAASSTIKAPTYGLSDSRASGASSASKEAVSTYGVNVAQVTSAYQTPSSSSVSGSSGVYGSATGSGVYQTSSTYQAGNYQPTTYQAGTSSSVSGSTYQAGGYQGLSSSTQGQNVPTYQAASSSGVYQSGSGIYQSGSGSSSGVYQSGNTGAAYQSGATGVAYQSGASGAFQTGTAGTYQSGVSGSGVFQSGTYQSGNYQPYQSGAYRPSTTTNVTPSGFTSSTSSSTYRYEKK
jgi:hypothetical protein